MQVETLLASVGIGAQLIIAAAILVSGKMIARGQYMRSMQDAWNDINKMALENPGEREVIIELLGLSSDKERYEPQRQFVAFIILNVLQASHIGQKFGLMDATYRDASVREILTPLLKDEEVYELTQTKGYHPSFKELCADIRAQKVAGSSG